MPAVASGGSDGPTEAAHAAPSGRGIRSRRQRAPWSRAGPPQRCLLYERALDPRRQGAGRPWTSSVDARRAVDAARRRRSARARVACASAPGIAVAYVRPYSSGVPAQWCFARSVRARVGPIRCTGGVCRARPRRLSAARGVPLGNALQVPSSVGCVYAPSSFLIFRHRREQTTCQSGLDVSPLFSSSFESRPRRSVPRARVGGAAQPPRVLVTGARRVHDPVPAASMTLCPPRQ